MDNSKKYFWFASLVFLAVFNAIFFVVGGTEHNTSVWISYAFIHLGVMLLFLMPLFVTRSDSAHVFGASLYSIWTVYFTVTFIAGLVFILVAPEKMSTAFIVQLIILGTFLVLLFALKGGDERIKSTEQKGRMERQYFNEAAGELKRLFDKADDAWLKKQIEKVYDSIKASPTKSFIEIKDIEENINDEIQKLKNACETDKEKAIKILKSLDDLIAERNKQSKLKY